MGFVKATMEAVYPKIAISGASGSGKTFSALRFATGYVGEGGRIAFIDTENRSARFYSKLFNFDCLDVIPRRQNLNGRVVLEFLYNDFVKAINEAVELHYDMIIIDSASHIWEGVLSMKSRMDAIKGSNSFVNWGDAGASYKTVIDTILQAQTAVLCCFRSKTEYVIEKNDAGSNVPKKIGTAPIARDGIEYEFTTFFDVDSTHNATTSKDRTGLFTERETITEKTGNRFKNWLSEDVEKPNQNN